MYGRERWWWRGWLARRRRGGTWPIVVCVSLLLGPPLYSGEGEHQPLHQGSPRAAAKVGPEGFHSIENKKILRRRTRENQDPIYEMQNNERGNQIYILL
jgi:hypothetical protein